jgi:hypothetical protein
MVSYNSIQGRVKHGVLATVDVVVDVLVVIVALAAIVVAVGLVGGLSFDGMMGLFMFGGVGVGFIGAMQFMAEGHTSSTGGHSLSQSSAAVKHRSSRGGDSGSTGSDVAKAGINDRIWRRSGFQIPTPPGDVRVDVAWKLMLASFVVIALGKLASETGI